LVTFGLWICNSPFARISMDADQKQQSPLPVLLKGILYSNIFAAVAFTLAYTAMNLNRDIGGIISWAEFVLVPVAMGAIAMKQWRRIQKSKWWILLYAVINTLVAIALSALFMGEGVICLIIVSPLLLGFMWVGVLVGNYVLWRSNNTIIKASTVLIYMVLFLIDVFSYHGYSNMVSDELVIHAPPSVVWQYVAAHPLNEAKSEYWLFDVGLPRPVQSTISADSVGAERKCIFSNGATFDEVIVQNDRDSVFTFDIVKQPVDPEIIGHINIERGQFILQGNTDGTTTLIGNSWYTLKVYPAWYYDLWAVDVTRNVHLRVMYHIKRLAEHDVQVYR